jgi:UDP-GlcNAc:undecaprenyl-phosphate GlcNAc-1-phosphate transferase
MTIVVAIGISLAATYLFTPLMGRLAINLDVVSRPDGVRRLHQRVTPLWGGIAVSIGLILGIGSLYALTPIEFASAKLVPWLCVSVCMLCLLGMADDRFTLSAHAKLGGQLLAILPVLASGFAVDCLGMFGWQIYLGWAGVLWAAGWLLLGINALNLLDGSDGLASIVGITIAVGIAGVAILTEHSLVALISLLLAAALLGFLFHNRPPARIYLGDCGSTVIGFVLALLALRATQRGLATADASLMGLLMFVPLLDTALAIVRRKLKGQSILSGDRGHLHHQLQERGFNAWQVMALVGVFCITSGLAACASLYAGWGLVGWIILGVVTSSLMAARLIAHQEQALMRAWLAAASENLRPLEPNHATPARLSLLWPEEESRHLGDAYPMVKGAVGGPEELPRERAA